MEEQRLKFQGDELYVYTSLPQFGEGVCKVELIMTKDIFRECYRRWIESQAESGISE